MKSTRISEPSGRSIPPGTMDFIHPLLLLNRFPRGSRLSKMGLAFLCGNSFVPAKVPKPGIAIIVMAGMKLFNFVVVAQGLYILVTALWGLLHIESFMTVTGPKTDVWLVKTVSAVLIPIGTTLLLYRFVTVDIRPAILLGSLTALALIPIDFYYSLNQIISHIYMLDGILQLAFLFLWAMILRKVTKGIK